MMIREHSIIVSISMIVEKRRVKIQRRDDGLHDVGRPTRGYKIVPRTISREI